MAREFSEEMAFVRVWHKKHSWNACPFLLYGGVSKNFRINTHEFCSHASRVVII